MKAYKVIVLGRRTQRFKYALTALEYFITLKLKKNEVSTLEKDGKLLASLDGENGQIKIYGNRAAKFMKKVLRINGRIMNTELIDLKKATYLVTFSPKKELPKVKRKIWRRYRVGNLKKMRTYQNEAAALKQFLSDLPRGTILQDEKDVIALKMDNSIMLHGRKRLTAFRFFVFMACIYTTEKLRVNVMNKARAPRSWVYFAEVVEKS